jgi:hypothetical protein
MLWTSYTWPPIPFSSECHIKCRQSEGWLLEVDSRAEIDKEVRRMGSDKATKAALLRSTDAGVTWLRG